jgi:hypothetical protein
MAIARVTPFSCIPRFASYNKGCGKVLNDCPTGEPASRAEIRAPEYADGSTSSPYSRSCHFSRVAAAIRYLAAAGIADIMLVTSVSIAGPGSLRALLEMRPSEVADQASIFCLASTRSIVSVPCL